MIVYSDFQYLWLWSVVQVNIWLELGTVLVGTSCREKQDDKYDVRKSKRKENQTFKLLSNIAVALSESSLLLPACLKKWMFENAAQRGVAYSPGYVQLEWMWNNGCDRLLQQWWIYMEQFLTAWSSESAASVNEDQFKERWKGCVSCSEAYEKATVQTRTQILLGICNLPL